MVLTGLAAFVLAGVGSLTLSEDVAAKRPRRGRRVSHRHHHHPHRHQHNRPHRNEPGAEAGCSVLGPGCQWVAVEHAFNCRGANLSNLVIPRDCSLDEADLSDANFTNTTMNGVELQAAYFNNSTLRGAKLIGANLIMTRFRFTDLTNADLPRADLRFADLLNATLANVSLTGVKWNRTTCPDGSNSDDNPGNSCCGHLNGAIPRDGC